MRALFLVLLIAPLVLDARSLVGGRTVDRLPAASGPTLRSSCDTTLLFYTAGMPQGLAVVNDLFWVM